MKKLILFVLLLSAAGVSSAAVVESGWTRTNNAAAARTALGVPGLANNNVFTAGTSNNIPVLNVGNFSATNSYKLSDVKHPKWGVKSDGVTDDTAGIQLWLNQGGGLNMSAGTYVVNPLTGLVPVSHSRITLDPKSIITSTNSLASNSARYWFIDAVEDVIVEGGSILCDQTGAVSNLYSMGVQVRNATNVIVRDMMITNAWFDGAIVQGTNSKSVTFENLTILNSARCGLALCGGTNIVVRNVIISGVTNNSGVQTVAGLDIEPDPGDFTSGIVLDGVYIDRVSAADGAGNGIYANTRANNITIKNSRVSAAGASGFVINTGITNVVFENCLAVSNVLKGFVLAGENVTAINCQSIRNLDDDFDFGVYKVTVLNCVSSGNGANLLTGNVIPSRLGIGRRPGSALDILTTGSDFPFQITAGAFGSGLTPIYFGVGAVNDGHIYMQSNGVEKVEILANGSSYFNGGRVGIGTNAPGPKLDVVGDAHFLYFHTPSNAPTGEFVLTASGTGGPSRWAAASGGSGGGVSNAATLTYGQVVVGQGNGGIATTDTVSIATLNVGTLNLTNTLLPQVLAPTNGIPTDGTYSLHILGNSNVWSLDASGGGSGTVTSVSTDTNMSVATATTTPAITFTNYNGTGPFARSNTTGNFSASGNVGVGTTVSGSDAGITSDKVLHIQGGSPSLRLDSTDSGGIAYQLISSTGGGLGYFGIYDGTSNVFRLVIAKNGNTTIGSTASTSSKLLVEGNVEAASLNTTGAGANGVDSLVITNTLNARTNIGSFDVVTTDFVIGTRYTNSTRRSFVAASFQLSAAVAGTAAVTLSVEQSGVTNRLTISAGPLASLITVEPLMLPVGPGAFYYFTDATSGSGGIASIVSGTSSRTDF